MPHSADSDILDRADRAYQETFRSALPRPSSTAGGNARLMRRLPKSGAAASEPRFPQSGAQRAFEVLARLLICYDLISTGLGPIDAPGSKVKATPPQVGMLARTPLVGRTCRAQLRRLTSDAREVFPSSRTFAGVYAALSMSIAIAHALLVPPFQSPDEENHFLRAVQLAQGSVVGRPTPDRSNAGAFLPSGAITVVESFRYLAGKPTVRLDRPALSQARSVEWDWKHQQFAGFGNTVIYPPFLYTPAVIGIWVASSISPLALDGLYAARLSNVLAATLISSLAVLICPLAARAYIASVLLLPMTLALFGSCAPDGFGIALVAIVIAIWSRSGASGVGPPIRILGAAILAIVSSAKLPYLPILGITLLRWPQGQVRWRVVGAAALVTLIPLGLAVWLALASKVEFRPDLGVASSAQLRLVLNHPFDFVMVMVRTGYMYGLNYVEQMIGVLGWLDNPLPRYSVSALCCWIDRRCCGSFHL